MPRVLINALSINNLRYADYTVFIVRSERDIQALVNKVREQNKTYANKLNIKMTQVLVATKKKEKEPPVTDIRVNSVKLLQIQCFKYSGTASGWNGNVESKYKQKVGVAKDNFTLMRSFLLNKNIALRTRCEALKMFILPIVFCNSDTWIVSKQLESRIKAFEMWCFCRMMMLSWQRKISNEKVVQLMQKQPVLLGEIRLRRLKLFGHVMSKRSVEHLIITGRLLGKKARGRERTNHLSQFPQNATQLIRGTDDRRKWRLYSRLAAIVWTYRPSN